MKSSNLFINSVSSNQQKNAHKQKRQTYKLKCEEVTSCLLTI